MPTFCQDGVLCSSLLKRQTKKTKMFMEYRKGILIYYSSLAQQTSCLQWDMNLYIYGSALAGC